MESQRRTADSEKRHLVDRLRGISRRPSAVSSGRYEHGAALVGHIGGLLLACAMEERAEVESNDGASQWPDVGWRFLLRSPANAGSCGPVSGAAITGSLYLGQKHRHGILNHQWHSVPEFHLHPAVVRLSFESWAIGLQHHPQFHAALHLAPAGAGRRPKGDPRAGERLAVRRHLPWELRCSVYAS